jgi:hypothetical protein
MTRLDIQQWRETRAMTIPNQSEREPDDAPVFDMDAPGTGSVENVDNPERLTGGAWLSLALSVSFYLVMLAIGAWYDSDHHVSAKTAVTDHSTLAGPMTNTNAPVAASSQLPAPSIDATGTLLARAHACAALAQWNCVIEATSGVIARQGNTPEARALLAQAVVNGGWVPGTGPTVASTTHVQNIRSVATTPPATRRVTKHVHRHVVRPPLLRYVSSTHNDFPSYLPDLYRH